MHASECDYTKRQNDARPYNLKPSKVTVMKSASLAVSYFYQMQLLKDHTRKLQAAEH